jgi:hypothetical protein
MKKRKSNKQSPLESLFPKVLPKTLEPELRKLYQLACKNSEPIWHKIKITHDTKPTREIIEEFISLTHKGMRDAQNIIVNGVLSYNEDDDISQARRFSYIGIADAIGWQLFRNELAYVKRFFMEQKPPSLREANINSVLYAVEKLHTDEPDSIALISDLTSFIQVGDIYHINKDLGSTILEVKSGEINEKILKMLYELPHPIEPHEVPILFQSESTNFKKQIQRVIRQKKRMESVKEVLLKNEGVDACTDIRTWYDSLENLDKECEIKGYAIDIIQDCLYIGCYKTDTFEVPGQLAFESWFLGMDGTADCPRTSLINCMLDPLGLPVYNIPIPDELKFDLLFGRKHICLAIHIPNLLKICNREGIPLRLENKKETEKLKQKNKYIWLYEGQAVVIGENSGSLGEGYALRVFYHGECPIDLMHVFAQNR